MYDGQRCTYLRIFFATLSHKLDNSTHANCNAEIRSSVQKGETRGRPPCQHPYPEAFPLSPDATDRTRL